MELIERIKRLVRISNTPKKTELPQAKTNETELLGKVNLHQDMKALRALALYGQVPEEQVKLRYGLSGQHIERTDNHSLPEIRTSFMQEAERIFLSRAPQELISDYLTHLDEEKGMLEMIATNGIEHCPTSSTSFYQRYGMDSTLSDYQAMNLKRNELLNDGEDAKPVDQCMEELNGKIKQQAEYGYKRIESIQSEYQKTQKETVKVPELLLRFSLFSRKENSEKKTSTQKQSKTF